MTPEERDKLRAAAEPMRNADGYMPVRPDAVLDLLDTITALTERAEKALIERAELLQSEWDRDVKTQTRVANDLIRECEAKVKAATERAERAERLAEIRAEAVSDMNRRLARMTERAERAERERDDLSAQLDAMTNQAVMLSGRRATIVDVSLQDALARAEAEVARLREELDAKS